MAKIDVSDAARRNVAIYYVIKGVRLGVSANSIQRTLQSVGLGYRRADLLADVSYYKSNPSRLPRLTPFQQQWFAPVDFYMKIPSRGATFNKFVFNVSAQNTRTNSISVRTLSYVSSKNLTPYEAFTQLQQALEARYDYVAVDASASEFVDAYAYG